MDYSLLMGIHNIDEAEKEERAAAAIGECARHDTARSYDGAKRWARQKSMMNTWEAIHTEATPMQLGEAYDE